MHNQGLIDHRTTRATQGECRSKMWENKFLYSHLQPQVHENLLEIEHLHAVPQVCVSQPLTAYTPHLTRAFSQVHGTIRKHFSNTHSSQTL